MIPPFPQEATQNGKRKKSKKRVCCPRSHIWEGLSETQIQKCQTAHSVPFSKSTSSWMQLLTREGMIAQTVGGTDTDEIRGNREGVWPRLGHRQDTLLKRRGWEVGSTIAIQQPLGSIPALLSRTSEGQPPALKTKLLLKSYSLCLGIHPGKSSPHSFPENDHGEARRSMAPLPLA